MPRTMRTIPQTDRTITRRIVKQVVKDWFSQTGFTHDIEFVIVNEVMGSTKELRSHMEKNHKDSIRSGYNNFAFIEYTEKTNSAGLGMAASNTPLMGYTFLDEQHGISLYPRYLKKDIEVSVRFRVKNKTDLEGWIAGLKLVHAQRLLVWKHAISYDVDIPAEYISFIKDAYTLKEGGYDGAPAGIGDGETLKEYLGRCFHKGVSKRSTADGKYNDIIIRERQAEIINTITNPEFYDGKDINEGIYQISIPMSFRYQHPLAFNFITPPQIRNKVIDSKYVRAWVPHIDTSKEDIEYPSILPKYFNFEETPNFHIGDGGSRLREWDDWFPNTYRRDLQTVTIVPTTIDVDNPKDVFNINDIPDKYLPKAFKNYFRKFHELGGYYVNSLVVIDLYEVGDEEKIIPHLLSDTLDITSYHPMNARNRYYVRISILKDLAKYNNMYTTRLLEAPDDALGIFKYYDDTVHLSDDTEYVRDVLPLINKPGAFKDQPSVLLNIPDKGIDVYSYNVWLRKLASTNIPFLSLASRRGRHVTQFNIRASER